MSSTTFSTFLPFESAREQVRSFEFATTRDYHAWSKSQHRPRNIPSNPDRIYKKQWKGWADWLGTAPMPFLEARDFARSLGIYRRDEWVSYIKEHGLPRGIPKSPSTVYKDKGWISWKDWLGRDDNFRFKDFEVARDFVRSLGLKSRREWTQFSQSPECPPGIPSDPASIYSDRWLGFGDWIGHTTRWNRNAILAFIKSLRGMIAYLTPVEVYSLMKRKGLIGNLFPTNSNAQLLRSFDQVCHTDAPDTVLDDLLDQLHQTEQSTEEQATSPNQIDPENEQSNAEIATVSTRELSTVTELPHLNSLEDLSLPDRLIASGMTDDEDLLEFLVNNRIGGLWQKALDGNSEELIGSLLNETGGDWFAKIRDRFLEQFEGAQRLPVPVDYSFVKNGVIQPPNLMQKLTAYRVAIDRRILNCSGTGAGKTLSAILASRTVNAQMTVIVAVNATIDHWDGAIQSAFPNSHVHVKAVDCFVPDPEKPNYLILNFESFQQAWSEELVSLLVSKYQIDLIVLDEVQSVRQRTVNRESKRRHLVRQLIDAAEIKNPDLYVLGMSATPVINNLHEGKTLLELVLGEDLDQLQTKPTVDNAIQVHQKLVIHGFRYRPQYSMSLKTLHPKVNGLPFLNRLRAVGPRNLLGLDQVLLEAKRDLIRAQARSGTLIYTQFVKEIVDPLREYLQESGLSVGVFTGEEKDGLRQFLDGNVDVLIGSSTVGTGIDGLQQRCNQLIFLSLPWTSAEYEQVVGRIYRQGTAFDEVEVVIPTVTLSRPDGAEWSWDQLRWERIQWKRTLADAAVDGVVPQGQLPSREEMQAVSLAALNDWAKRLEADPPEATE